MGTPRRLVFTLATVLLCAGCASSDRAADGPAAFGGRAPSRVRVIDDQWRFLRADAPDAAGERFDDAAWEAVTLPHTWNALDGSDGGGNYYRGRAWYRRPLEVNGADLKAGKHVYLRFGAAALVSDVYVNGTHVGEHRGGYAAFSYDVTDQVHAGKNVIAVRVDNARYQDVAPQTADFTMFGGLNRDVELLVLDPLHISPIDDAGPGVYLKQSDVSAASATLEVTTKVRNTAEAAADASAEIEVRDAKGTVISRDAVTQAIAGHADADLVKRIVIEHPQLWDGVRGPNLYAVTVRLRRAGGAVVDEVTQPLGLRTFKFDPDRGLMLNGEHYAMYGVNLHQEVANKGTAGAPADYDHRYALVREMGATTVRMAHYQHNDYEYALCDRSGLLVWAEVPHVNLFGTSPDYGPNLKQQLRELIKQNYNHPSIFTWSLLNEVTLDENDPKWQIVRDCNAMAKALDPSRPTTVAENTPPTHKALQIPDIFAFNRYTGWYNGDVADFWKGIDAFRNANLGRPVGISEYGAGGSPIQHELNAARVNPGGPWHPEEYQCYVHERAWAAIRQRPWLWGSYIWVMFDFSSDGRNEGDHAGRNDKGMVTYDERTRKDVFYFYQSQWTTKPLVYVTSRRYDPYPVGRSDVKVYSNCDEVELIQNGRSLGRQRGDNGVFVFNDVSFEPGQAATVARGTKGEATVEDRVVRTVSRTASTRTTPATRPQATTRPRPSTEPDPTSQP